MMPGKEALELLQQGNLRFVSNQSDINAQNHQHRRQQLRNKQAPHAIILGCSDSRVPAEIVFDQDIGDLFVIRVAGNIATQTQIGSIEFAAEQFGTRLVVVLGHSLCGAVNATLAELQQPSANRSLNLDAIVQSITPAVRPLLKSDLCNNRDELLEQAVRENIRASARYLCERSPVIDRLAKNDGLQIACAEYALDSGVVEFF